MAKNYKHTSEGLDPRDKNLVSYNKDRKIFVTEASSLRAAGIEPASHQYVIDGNKYIIWLWSEKLGTHICYRHADKVKSPDGELIADVFKPHFSMIVTDTDSKARKQSDGTELHILND